MSYVLDPSRRAHTVDALAADRLHRTLAARNDADLAARGADVATALLELGPKLAERASPCANYYISVPPLVSDKTKPRPGQASRIRALGPRWKRPLVSRSANS